MRNLKVLVLLCLLAFSINNSSADTVPTLPKTEPVQPISEVLIVEFQTPPSAAQLDACKKVKFVKSIDRLTALNTDYFKRTYEVRVDAASLTTTGLQDLKEQLLSLTTVKKVYSSQYFKNFSIIPASTTTPASKDALFNYQWNLHNNGQKVLNDITDIRPEVLEGKDGMDIGWVKIKDQLNTIAKRDVRVAVIDSGSTIDHPDLKNSFFRNMIECTPGGMPNAAATEDKDQNGFVGDCIGWSFATPDNKGSRLVNDDFGHGTHVGAIMAADSGNNEGVAGISNKIKLVPIKVYRNDTSQVGQMRTLDGFISNITKAVGYAIAIKAEVINISLGWPESADTDDVRAAFAEALKNNITVVAAAGNDTHNSLVYPCAYKGVICVGASSNNGTISDFSNFGGHVDILAPGNEILSAIPVKIDSEYSIKGYDIKWGTSQASPHVAAAAALLKSTFKNITADEIYSRLVGTSRAVDQGNKYFLSGLLQLDKALTEPLKPVVKPVYKDLSQIPYHFLNSNEGRFEVSIPLHNYGSSAQNVEVAVSSNLSNVKFENPVFKFTNLGASQEVVLKLRGHIYDLKSESNMTLNIAVKGTNITLGNYKHNVFLTRSLANDPEIQVFPIQANNAPFDIKKLSALTTLQTYTNIYSTPEYILKETLGTTAEPKGARITIFKNSGTKYVDAATMVFPNLKVVHLFIKTDLNYDGRPDYLLHYKDLNSVATYEYLNENLQPLFGPKRSAFVIPNVAAWLKFKNDDNDRDDSYESLRFLPQNIPGIGLMAVPLFMAEGFIPEIDQSPDPTQKVFSLRKRLFYYQPKVNENGVEFVTRAWMNYKSVEKTRAALKLQNRDYLDFSYLLPQSKSDFANGNVSLVVTWSRDEDLFYSKLVMDSTSFFKREYRIEPIQSNGENLLGHFVRTSINLDTPIPSQDNVTLNTLYSFTGARVAYVRSGNPSAVGQSVYVIPQDPKHKFPGRYFVRGYEKNGATYSFMMTFENLIMKYQDGNVEKQVERSITKYSNLPTYTFGENIEPIVAGVGNKVPAIFVDATQINAQHIYVVVPRDDKLVVPLETNLQIPLGCGARNPIPFGSNGEYAFTVLCQDQKDKFSIRHAVVK